MQSLRSEEIEETFFSFLTLFSNRLSQLLGPRMQVIVSNMEGTKDFDKLWLAWEPKSRWKTLMDQSILSFSTPYWCKDFAYSSSIQRTLNVHSSYVHFCFCPLTWILVLHSPHASTQQFRTSTPGHLIGGLKKHCNHYLLDFPYFFCLFFREMSLSICLIHLITSLTGYDKIKFTWNHSYSNYPPTELVLKGNNSHLQR